MRGAQAVIGAIALVAGCFEPQSTTCPGGAVCPPGLACIAVAGGDLCVLPSCGNGDVEAGESCDDGNHLEGDSCAGDCGLSCGNGTLDPSETCDDGNSAGGDGCSADCRTLEGCGNGLVEGGEPCDDGNRRNHDGCSSTCTLEQPLWHRLDTAPADDAVDGMTYDARRGRVVLFGTGRTWELD